MRNVALRAELQGSRLLARRPALADAEDRQVGPPRVEGGDGGDVPFGRVSGDEDGDTSLDPGLQNPPPGILVEQDTAIIEQLFQFRVDSVRRPDYHVGCHSCCSHRISTRKV